MDDQFMEVEKKPHARCPHCTHLVPVAEDGGFAYVKGHHYTVTETANKTERRSQRGGPDIRSFRTVERTVQKYCEGGSFRIVGRSKESEELELAPPAPEPVPKMIMYIPPRLREKK